MKRVASALTIAAFLTVPTTLALADNQSEIRLAQSIMAYRFCDNMDGLTYIVPNANRGSYRRCTNAFPSLGEAIGMACFAIGNGNVFPQLAGGLEDFRYGIVISC